MRLLHALVLARAANNHHHGGGPLTDWHRVRESAVRWSTCAAMKSCEGSRQRFFREAQFASVLDLVGRENNFNNSSCQDPRFDHLQVFSIKLTLH